MSTIQRVTEVFRLVFDDDLIEISLDMTTNDIEAWDSLSHINLIMALEAEFNIRFLPTEIVKMRNIGELITSIDKKVRNYDKIS